MDEGPAALPPRVVVYVAAVAGVGMAAFVVSAWVQIQTVPWLSVEMLGCYLLALLLFVGELRPLVIARADGDTDRVTVSSTFAVALVLTGPISLALAAQGLAVALDDARRGQPVRAAFNIGQYLLTLLAARATFSLTSGEPFLAPTTTLTPIEIGPALLAAATYFLVNNGTVAIVVALHSGQSALAVLREDVRVQGMASSILLGLAPVAAVVESFSPFVLPLLVLPLVGVQHNAWIAARRQHEALHDELTGLPNRQLFRLRAEREIARCQTDPGYAIAVMLLDLDHFKEVNDTLGHHVGDGLLREVSTRLKSAIPADCTLARLGGDEFALLVPDVASEADVVRIAGVVSDGMREPVVADGVRIGVQTSIGIALGPEHGSTLETLLQRADIALYRAKTNRGETQVYRSEIDQHTVLRLSLLADLHAAVDSEEFELVYQPQVDSRSGAAVAVEALMRWHHPQHGTLLPDIFIPLAESTGLIGPITRRALGAALSARAWLHRAGHDLSVAVNVSARTLSDLALPQWVDAALAEAGVPPGRLTIEVTESTITADPKRAMQVLGELREIGIRLAIDDFGTGYSSLSYLRRLQPDEIKIDKSFVLRMTDDENSAVIVRSTIELGHGLGLSVVAEGVEDESTYRALMALGCDRIQGFHVARPMTSAALEPWLFGHRQGSPAIPAQAPPPARTPTGRTPTERTLTERAPA